MYPRYFREEMETMPREQIEAMQLAKLQRQLAYVYERSPFYRRKLDAVGLQPADIQSLRDVRRLPFTTKDELRQSQQEKPPLGLHAAVPLEDVIRIHASSGTTGVPSYVGITKKDWTTWTEVVSRCYYAEGTRPDSRVVMGFSMGFFVGGLAVQDAAENIGATFIPVGTGASERIVSTIDGIHADLLTCTPSYAIYLAEYIRDRLHRDAREMGIRRILCGGEPGGGVPGVRRKIEDEWGAVATESLGNADLLPVYAAECEERTGNHFLAPEYLYLELIDPQTGEVLEWTEGASGELVATHLERECVPLVRFRTRDLVEVGADECPCGRTGVRLRCVGRTDDMLILLGVNVFPSAIRDVVSSFRPSVTGEVQIVLTEAGPRVTPPLPIKVECGDPNADKSALRAAIEKALREKLIFSAAVELVEAGSLPRYEMKANLIQRAYQQA